LTINVWTPRLLHAEREAVTGDAVALFPPSAMAATMILVIDNYDSFTWNLVHYLMELGVEVKVVRNDALTARDAIASNAQGFLISPGPCTPNEAGISLDLVAACAAEHKRSASISAARWCAAG
jgi:carbamoylphosphate synthase small subunit